MPIIKHLSFVGNLQHKFGLRLLAAALILGLSLHAQAATYKYKNDEGVMVLSTSIPADRAKYGYDIVDNYGNLIERIAPQLSDEAYKAKLARDAMIRECQIELSKVRKQYQFEADIDYALQKELASIDQMISNVKANLTVVTGQRQEFETQAAQLDIAGQPIPNALLDNIARAKAQENNLEGEIKKRYDEKTNSRLEHRNDRRVFLLANCDKGLPDLDEPSSAAIALNQEK